MKFCKKIPKFNFDQSSKMKVRYLSGHLGQVLLRVERLPVVHLAEHEGKLGWNLQVVDAGHGAASAKLKDNIRLIIININ